MPVGKVTTSVSFKARVSGNVKVNLKMYCLLICIAVYVDVVNTKDVIVFGDKFVT